MIGDDLPECFNVAPLTKEEAYSIRALQAGEANPYQQALALSAIIKKVCRTYDISFVPGAADQSNFLEGRAFTGKYLMKVLKIDGTGLDAMCVQEKQNGR